jgi:hypothetical protein
VITRNEHEPNLTEAAWILASFTAMRSGSESFAVVPNQPKKWLGWILSPPRLPFRHSGPAFANLYD